MLDLRAQYHQLQSEFERAVAEVMASGCYILGPSVHAFEQEVADFCGAQAAVAVASGTDALHLALRAVGVGPGDEVITTGFSFVATASAICFCGARPVFVDIDRRTFNLDVAAVDDAVTGATRAVLAVHLFGQPVAAEPLQELCRRHGLALVEDCAQAFGARRGGRVVGTFGDAGCFSFFPSKNLGGMGDGGMVVTASRAVAERLRQLRNHGSGMDGVYRELGFNSRLDELQAAVLRVKLRHVEEFNRQRRRVAQAYDRFLASGPLTIPYVDPQGTHVYHQYTVLSEQRDRLRGLLDQAGIASAIHYARPLPRQPVFGARETDQLPVADWVSARCLSLPMYPELAEAQIERVAQVLCQ